MSVLKFWFINKREIAKSKQRFVFGLWAVGDSPQMIDLVGSVQVMCCTAEPLYRDVPNYERF